MDIVTDTQHASSSDLITWNTLVMRKLRWLNVIPRKWVDIYCELLGSMECKGSVIPVFTLTLEEGMLV